MGARDAGWIHLFSENGQEAYENTIQAVRIAEHPDVLLPVMVMQDGFITSHSLERVEIYDDDKVKKFVGLYKPDHPLLDLDHPVTYGPLDFTDYYFEHKRQQVEAMRHATQVILDVGKEFGREFGRTYGLYDPYRLDDADIALVVLSSTAGTARHTVDLLRSQGIKIGLLKPRVFRPFPGKELVEALKHVKVIGVMDRSVSFGAMDNAGPLFLELAAAMQIQGANVPVTNYVFGLGGRDILPGEIEGIARDLVRIAEGGKISERVQYVGVRG
jgi:pyruvate ferredoxin oxidoreductase alpha subunit